MLLVAFNCCITPIGSMLVVASEFGVCQVCFGTMKELNQLQQQHWPQASPVYKHALATYVAMLQEYLAGARQQLPIPLDIHPTSFQAQVWAAVRAIPYGEVRSYSQIAGLIGKPSAARAVAQACAHNPVALLIPCHRVVAANGSFRGYRWGVQRKQDLLELEKQYSCNKH